jgi:hypothetical protein
VVNFERILRKGLVYKGDANAVAKGKIVRRIGRRSYGKITGRIAKGIFG